jgi:hypothetical protein
MQIEDLLTVILDPNLGAPWPEVIGRRPDWVVGRKWRVEYTFSAPGIPLHALAIGGEVRGIWRYEVIAEETDPSGVDLLTLRITPERRGSAGHHFIAQYKKDTLLLVRARRYEGDMERPFELRRLPQLDQEVKRSEDGKSHERRFTMKAPPTSAIAPSAGEDALVQPGGGAGATTTEE